MYNFIDPPSHVLLLSSINLEKEEVLYWTFEDSKPQKW